MREGEGERKEEGKEGNEGGMKKGVSWREEEG